MAVNMQLSTDEARDMDALVYLRHVDQWQRQIRLKSGRRVYGLPSRTRPGLFHLTDGSDCTCEDHTGRGARCAHMRAATLYRMERQGQIIADAKMADRGLSEAAVPPLKSYREIFPGCANGCGGVVERTGASFCFECESDEAYRQRIAAKRATPRELVGA